MTTPPSDDEMVTDRPHSARIYDYLIGGKDNYAVDRAAAENLIATFPDAPIAVRGNRLFMHRAARWMAEQGVDQFLDIGTGIPTEPNLHQIVQSVNPAARVVYVDNDPLVLAHAAALMVGDPRGAIAYVDADAADPRSILASPELRATLDFSRPVAISAFSLLHFFTPDVAASVFGTLVEATVPGSIYAVSHVTTETATPEQHLAAVDRYRESGIHLSHLTRAELTERFLPGLQLVEPGIVLVSEWHPDALDVDPGTVPPDMTLAFVARKPA
jgi:hypothetical protein